MQTMAVQSSEVLTFLIADLRGYTRFTAEHGDEAAADLITRFAQIAADVVTNRGGRVVELRGDEVLAAFGSARWALRAAVDLLALLVQQSVPLGVGIGVDAGEAVPVPGGYRGAALNLAARLCSMAGPGEILVSEGVVHLARKVEGLSYRDRGRMPLKGFDELVGVVQIVPADEAAGVLASPPRAQRARSGPTTLGRLLHRLRLEAELTQEEMAERASLSARTISDLERGVKTRPHRSTVELLADALGLSPEDRAGLISAGAPGALVRPRVIPNPPVGGFLGSLPEGRIVARERELDQILRSVDDARQGAGRLVLLSGEPGAGKTRLAQEATLALLDQGFLVAAGRCYEPQQSMPLFPLRVALSTLFAQSSLSIRESARDRWPFLAPLLPDHLAAVPFEHDDDQQRLFHAAAGFIHAVAETSPIAILVDDLHWSDTASVEVLLHLARETRSDAVFLLGTYRDAEVGQSYPLARALLDLERERLAERIVVRRLDEEGTAAMIAGMLGQLNISSEFAELIHRRTSGNPFFVQQVLRMLVERGDVYEQDGQWGRRDIAEIDVPEGVRALIGQRLAGLQAATREILREASVLGQTFLFDDVMAMTNRTEEEVEALLEEARRVALVTVTTNDTYAFDHALTQQTLYSGLRPRRGRKLHLAAAAAIERSPDRAQDARVVELAWHFLQGADRERAVVYALRAGDQATKGFAHAEAEQQFRTALNLAVLNGDKQHEAEAAESLGRVLGRTGRYDEAVDALGRSVALYSAAGKVEDEARVVAAIARVQADGGTTEEAIERLLHFLQRLGEGESVRTHAPLLISLSRHLFVTGQYVEAAEAGTRAAMLAREAHDDQMFIQAEERRLPALTKLGFLYDETPAWEELRRIAVQIGDLEIVCRALNSLGDAYLLQRDRDATTRSRTEAVEIAHRLGDPAHIAFMTFRQGWNAFDIGDWPQARVLLERALAIARSAGNVHRQPYPLFGLAMLDVAEGEWSRASAVLEECISTARALGDLQVLRHAEWVAADKAMLMGRPDLARSRLETLLDRPGSEETDVALILPLLAWAQLQTGNSPQADAMSAEAVRRARACREPDTIIDALLVRGIVQAEGKRWEGAAQSLGEAHSVARALTYPYREARVLYEWGRLSAQAGEPDVARVRLHEALAVFQRLGARPYIERTEHVLATTG